jgi:hypothetical protein
VTTGDLGVRILFGEPLLRRVGQNSRKDKGCDLGYALAARSCEGANSVEHAPSQPFDAITAFAVPNPNFSSQSRRFFQVWSSSRSPCRADHPIYFGLANFIRTNPFDHRRAKGKLLPDHCQCPFSVQCRQSPDLHATKCNPSETRTFAGLSICLFSFFHKVLHKTTMEIVWVLQGNQLNSLTVGTT